MIYIKVEGKNITLAGTAATQEMLDAGYIGYDKPIPKGKYLYWDEASNTIMNDDAKELNEIRVEKNTLLQKAYEDSIFSDIEYMSSTFQADENSQLLIGKVLSAGSVPNGFFWLDKNNNHVSMTYTDLQSFSLAILERGLSAFTNLQSQKSQVREATTIEELDAIIKP